MVTSSVVLNCKFVLLTYNFICLVHIKRFTLWKLHNILLSSRNTYIANNMAVVSSDRFMYSWRRRGVGRGDSAVVRTAAGAALPPTVGHSMAGGHSTASVAYAVGNHRGVSGRVSRPLGSPEPIRPLTLSFLSWVALVGRIHSQHYREPGVEGCSGVPSCNTRKWCSLLNVCKITSLTPRRKLKLFKIL